MGLTLLDSDKIACAANRFRAFRSTHPGGDSLARLASVALRKLPERFSTESSKRREITRKGFLPQNRETRVGSHPSPRPAKPAKGVPAAEWASLPEQSCVEVGSHSRRTG
jgi:hypothetical protein